MINRVTQGCASVNVIAEMACMTGPGIAGVVDVGSPEEADALAQSSTKLTPNASNIMDPDYIAMVLAMDTVWAPDEGEAHLTTQSGVESMPEGASQEMHRV